MEAQLNNQSLDDLVSGVRSSLTKATNLLRKSFSRKGLDVQTSISGGTSSSSTVEDCLNQNIHQCSGERTIRCPTPFPDEETLRAAAEKNAKVEQSLRSLSTTCCKCGALIAPEFMTKHLSVCTGNLEKSREH